MASRLDSKTKRASLKRGEKHEERLTPGEVLVYYSPKSPTKAGSWSWKLLHLGASGYLGRERIATADDLLPPNGDTILNFHQARAKAPLLIEIWRKEQQKLSEAYDPEAGMPIQGPYTVADAWKEYLKDAGRRGVAGIYNMTKGGDAQILPALGSCELAKLTHTQITDWHQKLAEQGKRKTGKARDEEELMASASASEDIRKRRSTANRILTNLKSALNFAINNQKALIPDPAPWKLVKPFANADSSRTRVLDPDEITNLINGCEESFVKLVKAGLLTGARYGELIKVRVADFNEINASIYFAFGKSKGGPKPRYTLLTDQGVAFFKSLTKDRGSNELMFLRAAVHRTKRERLVEHPLQWVSTDQKWAMEQACEASGVYRVTFHELRHTYASILLNSDFNLSYLADQLGHSDLRMVTKYYGHIAGAAKRLALKAVPPMDFNPPKKKGTEIIPPKKKVAAPEPPAPKEKKAAATKKKITATKKPKAKK